MQVVDEEETYGETPSELLEMVERSEERKSFKEKLLCVSGLR